MRVPHVNRLLRCCAAAALISAQMPAAAVNFDAPRSFLLLALSLQAADFNGDGIADLAGISSGSVGVMLGNGDGTFQAVSTVLTLSNDPSAQFTVGDFNGDGKPDLAVSMPNSHAIAILLGNGDGTFQAAKDYAGGKQPGFLMAADFNADGKLDLAVAGAGSIAILLGQGDGSFQAPAFYAVQKPACVHRRWRLQWRWEAGCGSGQRQGQQCFHSTGQWKRHVRATNVVPCLQRADLRRRGGLQRRREGRSGGGTWR